MYDQRGRMWKANGYEAIYDNGIGYRCNNNWCYINCLTNHHTIMDSVIPFDPPDLYNKYFPLSEDRNFTIKGLLRYAR